MAPRAKASRTKHSAAKSPRLKRAMPPTYRFSPESTLALTSRYCGKRYVVMIDERECVLTQREVELLIEYVVARLTSTNGYLIHEECLTVKNNPGFINTLADRLRDDFGDDSYLLCGNRCYYLPFTKKNIRICHGILEMKELNQKVIEKLSAVINNL
jgi:hypothetical protein